MKERVAPFDLFWNDVFMCPPCLFLFFISSFILSTRCIDVLLPLRSLRLFIFFNQKLVERKRSDTMNGEPLAARALLDATIVRNRPRADTFANSQASPPPPAGFGPSISDGAGVAYTPSFVNLSAVSNVFF